jgi:hypothetical protein
MPAKPGEKSPIYFAAESPPTNNDIPPESPLCYKFMVESPEDQLKRLKVKYPGIYNDSIVTNPDGTRTILAYRKDSSGKEIPYFYSTSPVVCSDYQRRRVSNLSPERILTSIYGKFDKKLNCWIYITDDGRFCFKIDKTDEITTKNGKRRYILATANLIDEQGEPGGSHPSAGLIGAFVVEEQDGNINLIAGDKGILMGAWGAAPTNWNFIKLGPDDYWGWQNTTGDVWMGEIWSTYTILAPYGKGIRELANLSALYDNTGICEVYNISCKSIDSSLRIDDSLMHEKVFPLQITVTGKIKDKILASKKYIIPFDTKKWTYTEPNNWPLKQ